MKRNIVVFLAVVSLLLLVTPAVSQVLETKWTANIPFDFIVGDSQMPAGEYMIKSNAQTMRLTVINKETQQKASLFTRHVQKLNPDEKTVLIFQREDGRHVLHQIWGGSEERGHDIVHGADVIELQKAK
jgi:hypothetical protein